MRRQRSTIKTRVLLSFSSSYGELAGRLKLELSAANIEVRDDQWRGGGGLPATRSAVSDVNDVNCVLLLLTPSDVAPMWIGEEWKHEVYDKAVAQEIHVLPVLGAGDPAAIPDFLRRRSFADLSNQDYDFEFRRLIETIRARTGDDTIRLPGASGRRAERLGSARGPSKSIVLELGGQLEHLLNGDEVAGSLTGQMLPMMYDGLFYEIGVKFPKVRLRVASDLTSRAARIVLNGFTEHEIEIPPSAVMVNSTDNEMAELGIRAWPGENPATTHKCAWIPEQHIALAGDRGLVTWDAAEYLVTLLSAALRNTAADFIGIDEVRHMLERIQPVFPLLVAETVPKLVSLFVLTDVLRRLVEEQVSIRNLRAILMALADWGRIEDDPAILTEYIRAAFKRYLRHKYARGQKELVVVLLDPEIETQIRDAIRHTATGSYLELAPDRLKQIVEAIAGPMRVFPDNYQIPCILTNMEVRATVRRLVATAVPTLPVLSYQELWPDVEIQPVGRFSLKGFTCRFQPWAEKLAAATPPMPARCDR